MTNLITRTRKAARRLLATSVVTAVTLPLGAAVSLGLVAAPASAAPTSASSAQATVVTDLPRHPGHGETAPFKALVFSKTSGFRHGSIPVAVAAIEQLGADHGFEVDTTEDAGAFTSANLAQYDVVIWVSTTGDVLSAPQQEAFEDFVEAGGGYAGIHAASDTEYDWAWYGDLVGAYFKGHPANQDVTVKVEDPAHPSTAGLPQLWERFDELYNYRTNPRTKVHVLASLDESTYTGGDMGVEHPITWCQDYDGGRSWYTGLGHTDESWAEPLFLDHVLGGIRTAAGVQPADCAATLEPSFEKVALDDNTANPMELAIAEDGRVFYVDRNGEVRIILTNGNVVKAGEVSVYTGQEFGLLGLALDPDFATNGWIYLYYSPNGAGSIDRVSRFTVTGNTMAAASATTIIDIPTQREQCCHAGGALEFDNSGNLYIATGDNTNPFDSDGYNPIDERAGRSAWDAQRTAANTNSLNGKVLRITPTAAGGYDVPAGNLFAPGTALTRPEIYAMGFRNPFRIGLDEQHDTLIVADFGPDAGADNANRGPNGRVEWNVLSQPGNYGWPYCVGNNTAYNDYNFATSASGPKFDCAAPVNNSPNNSGLTNLPPAKAATMWQSNGSATGSPEIGSSGAPMTSGTYSYDADLVSPRKWPAYFDSKAIWADWNNSRLFTVQLAEDGTTYTDVNRFLPNLPMTRPHALQFGPDGALYMIEWGSGFGGNNTDSGIYRIDYVQGNRAPIARATADKVSGPAPLTVAFDGSGSGDPDGGTLTYAWDFDGNDTVDSTDASPSHTYTEEGDYTARLTVTDPDGRTGVSNLDIVVGNTAPTVELVLPADGGFFEFGDTMRYEVVVIDPEDAEIDCDRVVVQPALGHDQHAHGYEQYLGCSGILPLPGDEGHVGANIFGTITATYTDGGHGAVSALTGQDTVVVHTKHKEAEVFDRTGRVAGSPAGGDPGVTKETTGDTQGGGQNIGFIDAGDYIAWDTMNLTKIDAISLRVASPNGATWEVRVGSETAPAIATMTVPSTGGWQVYQNVQASLSVPSTVSGPLYFVQTSGGSNLNWIDFVGDGVTENRRPNLTASADVLTGSSPLTVHFEASATDPDGDTPITFDWAFGDGATADTADAEHTYTVAGDYVAKVTATDSRGAKATRSFAITVLADEATCFTGRSDGFDGDALDTTRWDAVVRGDQTMTVADGSLNIPLTGTDIYGAGGTAVPNIVLQHLPGGAFTATTKVTLAAVRQYQQAGLILYGDDNNYVKLVVSGRSASPDKAANIVQFAKEVAGTATETNTNGLGASFPDTVWLRVTSPDGLALSASYSADGTTYTDLPGSRDLSSINEPRIGLTAFANNAAAADITASFDYFSITPDDRATPCEPEGEPTCFTGRSDGFDGTALDTARWDGVVRGDQTMTVAGGTLNIPLTATDIYGSGGTAVPNIVLQDLPGGAFEATTKVTLAAVRQYQQAGLVVYADDNHYLKLVVSGRSGSPDKASNIVQFSREVAGTATEINSNGLGADFPDTVWLRLTSNGTTAVAAYSTGDGEWTELPGNHALASINEPKIGLIAFANTAAGAGISAAFDWFTLTPDDTATPCEDEDTEAPEVATTVAGDYAGTVTTKIDTPIGGTATLSSTLAGSGSTTATVDLTGLQPGAGYESHLHVGTCDTLGLHYQDDPAGGGTPPNELWPTNPGWTSGPRIVAAGDGTSSATATVTWAPRSEARAIVLHKEGAIVACATLDLTGPGTVALDATDDTAVTEVEYTLDGGAPVAYTAPFVVDEPGSHTVAYRAADEAGNETTGSITVVVPDDEEPPAAPTVELTTAPSAPNGTGGWYTSAVTVTVAAEGGTAPLVLEYRVDGGDWTAYTSPVAVSADGTHQVEARATDAGPLVSEVVSTTVKVDRTAPVVKVQGIKDGRVLTVAGTVKVRLVASDATSGIASSRLTVDGRQVAKSTTLDAVTLTVGTHRVVATATDKAGRSSTRTLTVRVVATYAGAKALVKRLDREGRVTARTADELHAALVRAEKAAKQGQETQARAALASYDAAARRVGSKAVKAALLDVSRALRAQL